jgi:hypothetical protein
MSDALLRPYDVLQIRRQAKENEEIRAWLDFSTLRTEEDFAAARRIIANGWPDAPGAEFRVYRSSINAPVLVKSIAEYEKERDGTD